MVEQIPCPVCTLYLHPGMNLADHLETHPKEQVIKALVALATNSAHSLSLTSSTSSSSSSSSSSLSPSCKAIAAITATSMPVGTIARTATTTTSVPCNLQKSQQGDDLFHAPAPPPPPPPPLIQRGYPHLQTLPSSSSDATGLSNSKESKNGYIPSNQRNVMIVNRQSTMVYQAGDHHNQSIIGQQIALTPPPLQLFNISSYNQGKFLTPPPAYGTAISQLRSQNNQSSNNYARQNQSQLGGSTAAYCNASDQNALDYTVTKHLLPRQNSQRQYHQQQQQQQQPQQQQQQIACLSKHNTPLASSSSSSSSLLMRRSMSPRSMRSFSPRIEPPMSPSPSVLRFAESPITAHYVERDNGDFIVQETPRHVVECVEKDDGEFSVVEKVIQSPPSVVQFHESNENEDDDNQQQQHQQQLQQQNHHHDQNVSENNSNNDVNKNEILMNSERNTENNHDTNNDEMNKEEQRQPQRSKQKKTVSGLTVISNVKLNPNESLDLMENIMASSNNNEVEVLWSGIVNPIIEKIEQEDGKTRRKIKERDENEERIKSNENFSELLKELPSQVSLKEEEEGMETNESLPNAGESSSSEKIEIEMQPSSSFSSSTSAAATSVIRLASTPISVSSAIEITKISSKPEGEICSIKKEKENENKSQITPTPYKPNYFREITRRPFRKTPKKLVVKFKNAPTTNLQQDKSTPQTDSETEPKQSTSDLTESQKNSFVELDLKSEKTDNEKSVSNDECIREKETEIEQQNEKQSKANESRNDTETKIIETLVSVEEQEDKKLQISTEVEEKENEIKPVAPSIPAIHPMIVYESSLAEEPNLEENCENMNSNLPSNNEDKYTELSRLLDCCWKQDENKSNLDESNKLIKSGEIESEELIAPIVDISSDNNASVNSIQITETTISNIESQVQKVNESSLLSSSTSLCAASISLNSFPSTSNFSKPSTSSSALQQEQQTENQQNYSSQPQPNYNDYPFSFLYAANNSNLDKNRLSPLYPIELWKSYNGPIFQTQTDFQDIEDRERSSYIDLDALKKANSSDAVQYVEALNIRTDEKMPAKGEISEQESNGDVENSWSQPLGGEQPYRFFNHLENYVARESWRDEGFICPQTAIEDIKPKPSLLPPSSSGETTEAQGVLPAKKPRRSRKTCTSSTVKKTKIFTCDHCPSTFPKLRDRNFHLIVKHDYKRVNRRLVREPPPATITSAEQGQHEQLLQLQQQPLQPFQLQQPPQDQQSTVTSLFTGENVGEDIKPETTVGIVSTLETTHFSRTKYDSIRAGVYRMLMNFNLSVLKQKQNVEVDERLFELKTFSCFTCQRNFISVKQFDEHLAEHQAECFTCGRKFTRWSYFAIHLKRHIGWKDFECTHCNKRFVIRSALIEHMRMHTGISPLKCKHCGKSFKRYSNLTQHKRLCHSTRSKIKKEYVCSCGEVLPSKARFLWHREIHDTKPKCCPYCRDRFIHLNSLRRHIRLVHSEKFIYDQPAECPICNQIYAKNSLKGHMSTHSMDTQHECAICNKSFSTKWNLKIHSWVHANRTAKPYKCDMCIKAFVREIDYKNHINAHKQIKPFTCEYCGCKFIRKYNYLRHRREHHGQKKFRCELCGKQFHRHYYLIEHRRTHTGERPFLCTICGKSSTTKTNHNKHLKIHHSRDPFTSET